MKLIIRENTDDGERRLRTLQPGTLFKMPYGSDSARFMRVRGGFITLTNVPEFSALTNTPEFKSVSNINGEDVVVVLTTGTKVTLEQE